jgi:hypothetical protein
MCLQYGIVNLTTTPLLVAAGDVGNALATVILDRYGPLVSIEHVERRGVSSQQSVLVQGSLFDPSSVMHVQLSTQRVALSTGAIPTFRAEVRVPAETLTLPFEVADAAGNVTHGSIDLPAPSAPEETRMP